MWALISLKKYKAVLIIYSAGLFLNLILNLVFIPKFSFMAAALVTVTCEYLILLLLVIILFKEKNYSKL
jgi:O-antigen/teichoic acid export membrane protein